MGMIEDILKAFDRIPLMKEIQALPQKFSELEARVKALEAALERAPGEACPFCGALAFRLKEPVKDGQAEIWHCLECQKQQPRENMFPPVNRSGGGPSWVSSRRGR